LPARGLGHADGQHPGGHYHHSIVLQLINVLVFGKAT